MNRSLAKWTLAVAGLLILLTGCCCGSEQKTKEAAAATTVTPTITTTTKGQALQDLMDARDKGAITEEEFQKEKEKLLKEQ